ncbi:recombination directionality factor [Massilia sp. LjRoot122]|uniref:recombination directionality factor n=1 Tax=Massilia sp. LjRoot122 TaxID=3342257 RepID=UPI003ED0F3E4
MNAPIRMSILSSRAASTDNQIKHAGKIRPGIKVLTNAAQQNPRAVQLYKEGVAKRLKFSEIEKKIKEVTDLTNPMFPRNTQYFSVAASDFGMPEIAQMIVDRYGEVRDGDAEKRLYRFPVVFHSDDMNEVYPNQFKRHGGDPNYESHYGEDGIRYCRYLPEITAEQLALNKTRRIKKMPRREKVVRGQCEPGICHEFQQGQCKFRGRLMFYIPGIPTTGLMVMETSSEYAAEGIWMDLQRILDTLGTIPRMNPSKPDAPVFYITKVLEQRTYFDEGGNKKTGNQWVPKLQADIDIGRLLQTGRTIALPAASTPVAWLAAPKGMPSADLLPAPAVIDDGARTQYANPVGQGGSSSDDPSDQLDQMITAMELDEGVAIQYFDIKVGAGWEDDPAATGKAVQMLKDMSKVGNVCVAKLMSIAVKVAAMQIDMPSFNRYVFSKYGKGYTSKPDVLTRIEEEVGDMSARPREQVIAILADALSPV